MPAAAPESAPRNTRSAAKPRPGGTRSAAPALSPFSAQFMAPLMAPQGARPGAAVGHRPGETFAMGRRCTAGSSPAAGATAATGQAAPAARRPAGGSDGTAAPAASAQGPAQDRLGPAGPRSPVADRALPATPRHPGAEPAARLPPSLLAGAPGRALPGLTHLLADTLGDQLTLAARRVQAPVAYVEGEERHTWAEVERATDHLACGLLALGLKRGDRLGVLARNQIEWLLLFHAATRIGVALVALTLGDDDTSLGHQLSDSGAKVVFTLPEMAGQDLLALLGRLQAQLPQLRHVVPLGGEGLNSFASLAATPVDLVRLAQARRQVQASDLAVVIYTSATASADPPAGGVARPRGAGLSHRGLLAAAAAHAVHLRISDADLLHLGLPLGQVAGLSCGALALMLGGGSLVLAPDPRPERLVGLMARHRPTLVAAGPATLAQLLALDTPGRVDWQQVRLVCAGGAPVPAELRQALAQRMPQAEVMTAYGLTETSGAVAITRWQAPAAERLHTVGACLPGWQVRVVDPSGQAVPAGQVGELWLQGPGVLPGYVGAAAGQGLSADGWLMTGDLGQVDAQGTITLHGRLKDQPLPAEAPIRRQPPALRQAGQPTPAPQAAAGTALAPADPARSADGLQPAARRRKPANQGLRVA